MVHIIQMILRISTIRPVVQQLATALNSSSYANMPDLVIYPRRSLKEHSTLCPRLFQIRCAEIRLESKRTTTGCVGLGVV